jgi:hypothetical protein
MDDSGSCYRLCIRRTVYAVYSLRKEKTRRFGAGFLFVNLKI